MTDEEMKQQAFLNAHPNYNDWVGKDSTEIGTFTSSCEACSKELRRLQNDEVHKKQGTF